MSFRADLLDSQLRAVLTRQVQAVFEEIEQEQRAQAACAIARAARSHHVGGDAHIFLADDLQGFDERDSVLATELKDDPKYLLTKK